MEFELNSHCWEEETFISLDYFYLRKKEYQSFHGNQSSIILEIKSQFLTQIPTSAESQCYSEEMGVGEKRLLKSTKKEKTIVKWKFWWCAEFHELCYETCTLSTTLWLYLLVPGKEVDDGPSIKAATPYYYLPNENNQYFYSNIWTLLIF